MANSLSRAGDVAAAVDRFRWERLGPLRAAESQPDERGRAAASTLRALRAAVAADEFATRLGPELTKADDALFDWLAMGQPAEPAAGLPEGHHVRLRADDVRIPVPPPGAGGRATRAKGGPASEVLGPLEAFLREHRDEQVVVEWRVQE